MDPSTFAATHPGGARLHLSNARQWPLDPAARGAAALQLGEPLELLIEGGRVRERGFKLATPAGFARLDAQGLALIPGLVDVHVHFRDPGLERKEGWERGSAGALHGGVTSVGEVQNNPPLSSTRAALLERLLHVGTRSRVDYGCFANLLPAALPELVAMAPYTPAFKCFLGGSTGMGGVLEREVLAELFAGAARAGRLIVAHCEDETQLRAGKQAHPEATAREHHLVRSAEAEIESIRTSIELIEQQGGALHVFHVSSAGGAQLIGAARARGLAVVASTAPHYLLLSCEDAPRLSNLLKVNPSIKTRADCAALLTAVESGAVDAIGTDHAPHPLEEKLREYAHAPSGMPSVDLLWPLTLELVRRGQLSAGRALDAVTRAAARSLGLLGKGGLEPGDDADVVLFDPREERVVRAAELPSTSKWSAYEGWTLAGFPRQVLRRGELVFERGRCLTPAGGAALRFAVPQPASGAALPGGAAARAAWNGGASDLCCS